MLLHLFAILNAFIAAAAAAAARCAACRLYKTSQPKLLQPWAWLGLMGEWGGVDDEARVCAGRCGGGGGVLPAAHAAGAVVNQGA